MASAETRSPDEPIQLVCAEMLGTNTMALIGRDARGDSVAVCVDDVHAYLWVRVPDAWKGEDGLLNSLIWESFLKHLNLEASDKIKKMNSSTSGGRRFPHWVIKKMGTSDDKDSIIYVIKTTKSGAHEAREFSRFHGYDPQRHLFARIAFTAPDAARVVVGLLEHPTAWMRKRLPHRVQTAFELAEATLDVTTQACADMGLTPGGWFALRAGIRLTESTIYEPENPNTRYIYTHNGGKTTGGSFHGGLTLAENDIRTRYTYNIKAGDLVPLPERTGLAPLKVISFDIETLTKDLGHGAVRFYDGADEDGRCLCIAACSQVVGRSEVQRVVFAIDPDIVIPRDETVPAVSGDGSTVRLRWLPDETRVLLEFSEHVRKSDADFVTGWNTDRFDFGWLALAAKRLNVEKFFWDIGRFPFPGPKAYYNTRFRDDTKKKVVLKLPGRVPYDLMTWFRKNLQLPDYKLQNVAEAYGCGSKDDVAYGDIGNLFKSPAGRVKLALYCEQDTALVLKLVANPKLDPVGKDMALCSITGVWPTDLLGRGTQNTLRCKILRVAHARGFVLPHVPGPNRDEEDAPEGVEADAEEEDDNGYQGGKVLTAQSGRYTDAVVVFDFASLYPSCMLERNICKSSQLTRARALELGVPFTVPPAPSLTGTWRTPGGADVNVNDDFRTGVVTVDGDASFRYQTDLNEAIVGAGDRRAVLEDSGYALRWHTGDVWKRHDEDVLCFTSHEHFVGLVPQLEADLKVDRKAAKKRMAQAEAAGDSALQQFENNLQNSIKVLMNGLYGGFGASKGGIFPEGFKLAAAITSCGRGWICTVKKTVESNMWVANDQRWGIGDKPVDASFVRVIYGDTDSVFCHLPGLSLQSAAAFGDAVSKYFGDHVLPKQQCLEFEKIYWPMVLYRKKMYSGTKYEGDYSEGAKGKLHSRGIALVRRDNAYLVRSIMKSTLDSMLKIEIDADGIVESVARYMKLVQRSAASIHRPDRPDDHLPMQQFVLSAGLSKDLDDYAGVPNAAAHVAARLMEINPLEKLGAGTRVVFVVRAQHKDAKRGEQACLVEDLERDKLPLDSDYYIGAIRKKCEPLLSALFVAEEKRRATFTGAFGGSVTVEHAKASERQALPGQNEAARRLTSALAQLGRVTQSTPRDEVEAPRLAPVFARFAAAAAVPRAPAKPAEDKKRKSGDTPAHAMLKALKTHAAAKKANASE